jgi:glyoxylase-like metal-dependent hydrolase (beta-lactamase superfamily II)
MITVSRFVTGPIETNCYLVGNEQKKCVVIDPAGGMQAVLGKIAEENFDMEAIVLTHGHFDHILGIPEMLEFKPDTPVYIHPVEAKVLADARLNLSVWMGTRFTFTGATKELAEGKQRIGSFEFDIFHIPGHTQGQCALAIENHCFCGDTIIPGSIGRSDFPGGDGELLIESIKKKLMTLPDNTIICSGHGGRSTIGRERKNNPFLR